MKFIVVLALMLAVCFYAWGQETQGESIIGIVTDSQDNTPVFGAKVEVLLNGSATGISAYTDENGKYTFKNVPEGNLTLSASKLKYLTNEVSGIDAKVTSDVNILLTLITPIQMGEWERDFSLSSTKNEKVTLSDFKDKSIVILCVENPYG